MALGLPLFWAVRGARDEPDRVRANAKWARAQSADFLRVFCDTTDWTAIRCADGSNQDRRTDPRWPGFIDHLRTCRDICADEGQRIAWTLFGGNQLIPDEQWRCLENAVVVADERPEAVQAFEISNENNGFKDADGPNRMRAMAEVIARHGFPVTLTSAAHGGDGLYAGSAATWANVHFERTDGDNGWRWVRQPWGYPGEYGSGLPAAFGTLEPGGPGASVHSDMDPLRIAMAAVHTWLCGGGIHVVHCGAGIYGVQATHATGTRVANLWEQPSLSESMMGISAMRALLPADVPNWTRTRHGGVAHPFSFPFDDLLQKYITVGDLAIDNHRGCVRAYAAYKDGRYVCAFIGVMGACDFAPRHAQNWTVWDVMTRAERRSGSDILTLSEQIDGRAVIITGDYA